MVSLAPSLVGGGIDMIVKAMNGGSITFSKIALGTGTPPADQKSLKALVKPVMSIGIQSITVKESYVMIRSFFRRWNRCILRIRSQAKEHITNTGSVQPVRHHRCSGMIRTDIRS